jgi:hypothetical protein
VGVFGNGKSADRAPEAILALSYPLGQPRLSRSRASEDAMPDETPRTDLFEIIRTTRSVWRLKPEPVPNELIRTTTFHPPASLTCRTSRGESPYDGGNVTTKGGLRHAQGLGTP